MLTATTALDRLREGNRRYVSGLRSLDSLFTHARRAELAFDQSPFAIVLGCADSRVPVEIIFDQGLGDIFVVRIAGNVTAQAVVGSIEFAAQRCGTRLIVVLGHTRCIAVSETIEHLQHSTETLSENIAPVVDCIRPSVESLVTTQKWINRDSLLREAVRANIRASVSNLRQDSTVLKTLIERADLQVIGAEYSLETGIVDFFD